MLFQEGVAKKNHHLTLYTPCPSYFRLIHSFIIDENDRGVRSLFEPVDWTFIMKKKPKELILNDLDVTKILERFRGMASTADIMEDLKDRLARHGATYVFSKILS
ncbi:MAG: hypothetical protein BYD32DRAFT_439346 [Podila humilis]|nr:MAG: hypothetical protein BYD32DRAFT_439346 [Podila humilis]